MVLLKTKDVEACMERVCSFSDAARVAHTNIPKKSIFSVCFYSLSVSLMWRSFSVAVSILGGGSDQISLPACHHDMKFVVTQTNRDAVTVTSRVLHLHSLDLLDCQEFQFLFKPEQ